MAFKGAAAKDRPEKKPLFPEERDFDALAGTWSDEEAEEMVRSLHCFAEIDEDQWK